MSIYPTTIRRRRRSAQRGSVALAAIVALVVVFIIGLGLLTLGGNARLSGKRAMRLSGAQAMASSGVEYGYWQVMFNNQTLPYTTSRSLGSGSFSVTVTDNSASLAGTMKIVSTGAQSGDRVKTTKVMKWGQKTIYDYALCSNTTFSPSQAVVTGASGANGDTRANGSISLPASSVINGDVLATGTITGGSVTGATTRVGAPLTFPALDLAHYQSIANRTYNSSQMWNGFTFLASNEVVYVNGDIVLNGGSISGTGTLVASGSILIQGNLSYLFPATDKAAMLSAGGLSATASGVSVVGFYYIHNSSSNATVTVTASKFKIASGSLAADQFILQGAGPHTFIHDPAMNSSLAQQLHLP